MNIPLIKKIIQSNNVSCPDFTYKNPLLDINVARALSKSFVKILRISKENSKINNKLRFSILENIRQMCQVQLENHVEVDDNITELLTNFYKMQIEESTSNFEEASDKELEVFLMRKLKEINLDPSLEASLNCETVQALLNCNKQGVTLEKLTSDIGHWQISSDLVDDLMTNLQTEGNGNALKEDLKEDKILEEVSVRKRPEIEMIILETCENVLANINCDLEDIVTSNEVLMDLVKSCAKSPMCFQMCCGILNFLFIITNFDKYIHHLIVIFVKQVKKCCGEDVFSILYSQRVSTIVVLLNINLNALPPKMKDEYIKFTLKDLKQLHMECESDFVLVMSHFPQWFDIYFKTEYGENS